MPKKFFDIIPPSKTSFQELKITSKKIILNSEEEKHIDNSPSFKKRRMALPAILLLVFFFLAIGGAAGLFFIEKVKIEIWPKTDSFNAKKAIIVDINKTLDYEKGIIPGEILKDQKAESQEFDATGKAAKEEKASGIIKIYNNFSSSPQSLIANTRFVSADGKVFKSLKKETIPGGNYDDKGKFSPGSVDIEIIAVEPGEDYNIGPSTFSIPGFAGTPKYTSFYGKSFSDMKGGFKGETWQVVQADLDQAENILLEKLKKESREFLNKSLPEGNVLLEEAVSYAVLEKNFSAKAGDNAKNFSLQLKIESKAVIFKKADIEKIVEELIALNVSEKEKFQKEKLEINYHFQSFSLNNEEIEKMNLDTEINAKIYQDIPLNDMKKTILGKPFSEVKLFLSDQQEISKVKIDPGFFWRRTVPNDEKRIEINLKLD